MASSLWWRCFAQPYHVPLYSPQLLSVHLANVTKAILASSLQWLIRTSYWDINSQDEGQEGSDIACIIVAVSFFLCSVFIYQLEIS